MCGTFTDATYLLFCLKNLRPGLQGLQSRSHQFTTTQSLDSTGVLNINIVSKYLKQIKSPNNISISFLSDKLLQVNKLLEIFLLG